MRYVVRISLLALFLASSLMAQDDQPEVYEPPRDHGVDWRASALLEYSSDDGLLVGGGPILYKFGFRKLPYVFRMQLVGGVALKTGALKFEYTALYPAISEILSAHVLARFSEVEVRNFYGFGNDSERDADLDRARFYRINSRELIFNPMIWVRAPGDVRFGGGVVLKHFAVRKKSGQYLYEHEVDDPYGNRWFLGGKIGAEADTRNREVATTSGVFLHVEGASFPDLFGREAPLHRVSGDARVFLTAEMGIPVTLALRAGGATVYGTVPFRESAFIGGPGTLRGFNYDRFAGDAAAFINTDVRATLFRMKFFVPTTVGVFALCDAGRVWVDGNSPESWHVGVGGGISLAPIDPSATVIVTLASSKDGLFLTAGLGFEF